MTRGISLDQVRRYMLKEFGLSFCTSSMILRDLARIRQVKVVDGRVVLQRDEANMT